jgi:hypothetical protein
MNTPKEFLEALEECIATHHRHDCIACGTKAAVLVQGTEHHHLVSKYRNPSSFWVGYVYTVCCTCKDAKCWTAEWPDEELSINQQLRELAGMSNA